MTTSDPTYPEFQDSPVRWILVAGRLRHELVMQLLDQDKSTKEGREHYERIMGGLDSLRVFAERMTLKGNSND
jgi:hypothetical protein